MIAGCIAGVAIACIALGQTGASPDRIIGLLTLPEVFGNGACDRYSPRDVTLYAAPDGGRAGTIRVVTPWTHQAAGGCEGLDVRVQNLAGTQMRPLPVEEYDYESPAVVVLERKERWFRVRLEAGSAWVHASDRDEFHALEGLLTEGLAHLTRAWDGRLWDRRDAPARKGMLPPEQYGPSVRVVRSATAEGRLWLFIEMLSHSGCDGGDEPRVVDRGWVPAHAASGEPTVWFSSRGC